MKNFPPDFNPGLIPRDLHPAEPRYGDIFGVPYFDWDAGFDVAENLGLIIKVDDQGLSLSCVGQAFSKYAEILNFAETKKQVNISARDVYSRIFIPPTGGAYLRSGAALLARRGAAEEYLVPSGPEEVLMREVRDDSEVEANAKIYKAREYAAVAPNIDEIANAVKRQNGLVIGVIGSNEGWQSSVPRPPEKYERMWGHSFLILGAKRINGIKTIYGPNSWGEDWGQHKGFVYITEEYFHTGYVFHGYTVVDLPNPETGHIFLRDLIYRERSQEVKFLQDVLKIEGTFPKSVLSTGYYGSITAQAVYDFQVKHNVADRAELDELGGRRVGPKTRGRLNMLYSV